MLFAMLNPLYFYISTFRSMGAVPNMAVFCSSLISCVPVMFLMYYLSDCEMVRVAPVITGITFVFTFHVRCVSVLRSLYFRIYAASFFITCLSLEILTCGIVTSTTVLRRTCNFDTDHLRQACARSDYPSELWNVPFSNAGLGHRRFRNRIRTINQGGYVLCFAFCVLFRRGLRLCCFQQGCLLQHSWCSSPFSSRNH
jgi:hypothetical protein